MVLAKPDGSPAAPAQEDILGALLEEDEMYVGCEFSGTRGMTDQYALAEVHSGFVSGLPDSAPETLRERILGAATGAFGPLGGESPVGGNGTTLRKRREEIATTFSARDLIVGGDAHRKVLRGVLRRASSRVVVHSTFLYAERFGEWLPLLREAVGRGAEIDVLWGASPEDGGKVVPAGVAECRRLLAQEGILARHVRLYPFSTGSHAKLLLADDGDDGVVGCLGSCNWFSTGFNSLDVSARFRDPRVVAEVASCLSRLARTPGGHASRLTNELAGLAWNLRKLPSVVEDAGKTRALVRFFSGAEHNGYVRLARDQASDRIVVASHRLSPAGRTSVVVPTAVAARETGATVNLYYEKLSGKMTEEMAAALAESSSGVGFHQVTNTRMHAKVLAWDDDDVVISSLNWLSSDPGDGDDTGEIGVHIHREDIGEVLITRIAGGLDGVADARSRATKRDQGVS